MEPNDLHRVARWDQAQASLTDLAKLIVGYHRALVAEGMDEAFAFSLVLAYQDSIMEGARRHD